MAKETEAESKKTRMKDAEAEEEVEKESEAEAEDEEEEERYKKKPKKKKKEAEMEDMDDEDEEEETEKGEQGGENPQEQAQASNTAGSTLSPNAGVPSTQNVFVPRTNIATGRNASTSGNMVETYSGKSIEPDVQKSPLFVGLSEQMDKLVKSVGVKLDSVEKSVSDRIANLQKKLSALEEFYNKPVYKAISENVSPEGVQRQSIQKQIDEGKIKYSQ